MNNIEINIPDNLTPDKELLLIAKKLQQKQLSGSGKTKEQLRIGTEVTVQHLQTQITINRTSTEKPIEMVKCNVCGCEYQNNTAVHYWRNYGGKPKQVAVCSTGCQNAVIEFLGKRAAKTKNKLSPIRLYN